ncbi:MAG: hypothetical protein E7813_21385 [Bradyrhizobium sp.]|uniref:hypothetical protein n=1 Tax=Bradyrhizobium sp. TaxID=376 RepID=UPI0011FBF3CC|nr:hypothetical protein [Bradyrhizobium sp.]THD61986.1 MAG: hypothetical protein E7813_21385 [Bradyrhizobium sp.]
MSELVRNHLVQLLRSLGSATPPIDPTMLRTLYDRKDYPAMLGWIKNSMRLDLSVGLRIVDSTKPSAPMWIETPKRMPSYGTREFRNTRVIVNVRRDLVETKPFGWVVAGFAHELSHVVLFSIGHPLQHEEKAVDLTAMILGYPTFVESAEITKTKGWLTSILLALLLAPLGVLFWRGTSTQTTRLGYLTKSDASFARNLLANAPRTA